MQIKGFFDDRTYTVTFVVWDESSRDAVVIDPVLDYDPVGSFTFTESVNQVSDFVRDEKLRLRWVLETHAHADHLSASQLLKKRFEAPVAIGENIKTVQKTFKGLFGLDDGFATDGSQFDRLLSDGETLEAGTLRVEVIATPGHTPACVTFKIGDAIFTGDLLFMDDYGTGRCDFPAGSAEAMYDSMQKIYALPDATRVFVGHDYMPGGREPAWESTVAKEKERNPQLSAKTTREQFIQMRTARDATLAAPKLLFQSVQVNIDAGHLPPPAENGHRYFRLPLNLLRPANELGEPIEKR
ncbi:MAG: MBL fold metallo-hydrolase [Myxococcales bacterium]|nr:MBL fold metallo-hydrolase [Myxococcales bacterium]MCB9578043.1 MBL fold metallo-hydrolase [Polyangiaceae bacterium]